MRTHPLAVSVLGLVLAHCGPASAGRTDSALPDAVGLEPDAGPGLGEGGGPNATTPTEPLPAPLPAPGSDAGGARRDGCAPGASDAPDDMGLDTNCDGADGVVGTDVYVDPAAGQDTNDGSPTSPLQSLVKAQSLAASRGGHILMTGGQFSGDTFALSGNWSLFGGYSPGFVGAPDRQSTVFSVSANGLLVDGTTKGVLAHVTVQAALPTDPAQPSVHVLRSRATDLSLHDVALRGADGAAGSATPAASDGASGDSSAMCAGLSLPPFALGQRYGMVSPDSVTKAAVIDGSGGQPAQVARAGNSGTDGQDASDAISLVGDLVVGSLGTPGLGNGTPGFGGAGGGANSAWLSGGTSYDIWGGKGGNGGCPGAGGSPGSSGGTSVALVVLAGHVDVTTSTLQAGFGGNGADGAAGGLGGLGGAGGPPELVSPAWLTRLDSTCTGKGDPLMLACAEYGGQGGPGGAGGHGGAGAGGWSVGVLVAPGASYTVDPATTIAVRKPGVGGQGASVSGPSGRAAISYTLSR